VAALTPVLDENEIASRDAVASRNGSIRDAHVLALAKLALDVPRFVANEGITAGIRFAFLIRIARHSGPVKLFVQTGERRQSCDASQRNTERSVSGGRAPTSKNISATQPRW
jgi:hypothetical protein